MLACFIHVQNLVTRVPFHCYKCKAKQCGLQLEREGGDQKKLFAWFLWPIHIGMHTKRQRGETAPSWERGAVKDFAPPPHAQAHSHLRSQVKTKPQRGRKTTSTCVKNIHILSTPRTYYCSHRLHLIENSFHFARFLSNKFHTTF